MGQRLPTETSERLRVLLIKIDAKFGGRGCFRNVLVRRMLDVSCANKPVLLGIDPPRGQAGGHAWIDGDNDPAAARPYALILRL